MIRNYAHIAEVLSAFSGEPRSCALRTWDLADRTDLSEEALLDALRGLANERKDARLLEVGGVDGTWTLTALGRKHVGANAAQLLALDVRHWILEDRDARRQFLVERLPDDLRHNSDLLELALKDLEAEEAILIIWERGHLYEIRVHAEITVYGSHDARSTSVQVSQHIGGDFVIGGKYTAGDGSAIATHGGTASVNTNTDAVAAFIAFVDALRAEGEIAAKALDVLSQVATPGLTADQVATRVCASAAKDERIVDRLRGFLASATASLAGSAVVEGVKLALTML